VRLIIALLRRRLDPDGRVHVLLSSEDAELGSYFDAMGAVGSTDMDFDTGNVYVKIHDAGGATPGTWLEELAHAVQFLKYGNVALSVDQTERRERELEVAGCLALNAGRFGLSDGDMMHIAQALGFYGQAA